MAIAIPFLGLVDIRQPILGDSFGWAGIEPTAAKKSVLIHHSASPTNQDGFDIASYHVNNNNWGGIGYHFVITHDDYPGRANFTPAGAQVQYVGDLGTYRAHALNDNPGRVGICLVGNFVNGVPGRRQLELARQLVDFLLAPNYILPSLNYPSQIIGHGLLGGQSTACPGFANANFAAWYDYVRGGAFPAHLYESLTPPIPDPPLPTPVPVAAIPEYEATFYLLRENRVVAREGAHGVDVVSGDIVVPEIPLDKIIEVAGYFTLSGTTYARTVYAVNNNKWNGLDISYFDAPTGQPSGEVPIRTPEVATPAPDPIIIPDPTAVQPNVTDGELAAATVPETPKLTLSQLIKELLAQIIAFVIKRKKS